MLTNALKWASEDSDYGRLNKWAVDYNSNVNTKYGAVTKVLIALGGEGLLTSANGLGGCDASLPIMKANIEAWGACSTPTEFFEAWFQSPRKDLERAGACLAPWLSPRCQPDPPATPPALAAAFSRSLSPLVSQACSRSSSSTPTFALRARSPPLRPSSRSRRRWPPRKRSFAINIDQSGAWAPEENGIKTVRPWLGLGLVRVS